MSSHSISTVTGISEAEALLPEWEELFSSCATANVFAHPQWQLTWARHFIRPEDLVVVTVRNGPDLVGVAPFHQRCVSLGRGPSVTFLQLLGAGKRPYLTELPAVLTHPSCHRSVLRETFRHLESIDSRWDWIEVTLAPEQGWFEPEWLAISDGPRQPSVAIHKATRPCVVMPLAESWEATVAGLKRNVRESIRRGANRLARDGHSWRMAVGGHDVPLDYAFGALVDLHNARAQMRSKPYHAGLLAKPSDVRFLSEVTQRLAATGHVVPCLLLVDERPVAARLLLRADDAIYLFVSGNDPDWWEQGVGATLIAECLKQAIGAGCRMANLSTGVDVSKLRWSEKLELYQDFVVVRGRRRSRAAFCAYWQLRAASLVHRERVMRGLC
jgi:CelD/BcsL family acetyltransferase involved in cellulose biosynthesis